MASSYDNDLRLNEQGTGDNSGSWGTVTNLNLEMIAEAFSYGTRAIANASTDNITLADGALDADRSMYLRLSGGGQACTVTFLPATISKVWLIENATSATLTMKQGSSPAGIAIPAGQVKMIATDGGGSANGVVYDLLTDVNLAGTTVTDIITANQATVDDIDLNGKVITLTGSSGDTATLTVAADGALAIATTDAAAAAANISITADGTFTATGTTITLDSAGDIILDADGADVIFKDGGTAIGTITNASSDLVIKSNVQDKDILLKGDDGGTEITALSLDMSAGGNALFSGTVTRDLTRGSIDVGNSSGVSTPLAAGGVGTVLTSDGTDLSFAAAAASAGVLSKTATGAVAIRRAVQIRSDGNAEQVQLSSTGDLPVLENAEVTYTTSSTGYSFYGIAVNAAYTEFVHALQAGGGKIVACTLNSDGTVTTSSESSWAGDPATNSNYQYGGVSTAARAYVFGVYGNNGQAYVRGAYTTGNAGSVSVASANTLAIDGGGSAGQWEIGTTEEGYFFVVKYESSNAYIKFGSQNASNGQISLAGSWTQIASTYGSNNKGVGVDQATKKVVIITSTGNTNSAVYCTTIQRGSGTAAGTKSATVSSGWNSSSYGGVGFLGLAQDGTTNKMVYAMQYGKEGQGGATNNSYGNKTWFTVIDTSGTNPVWNNKNASNDLWDYPAASKTNNRGESRPYGLDTDGARFTTGSGDSIVSIRTNGTDAGTSVLEQSFQPLTSTNYMALYNQDGSGISVGGDSSTSGTVIRYGFANLGAVIGISSNAVSSGGTVEIDTVGGKSSGHSNLTPSKQYYANPSDGTLVTTQASTDQQSIGLAVSATEILIGVE